MKIILASGNKGKIKELKTLLPNDEVIPFKEILGDIEVDEDQNSFKGNAVKKARTIYDMLKDKIPQQELVVISDDSGITVPALNNEPGIYSARYAGANASDEENNLKLISKLKEKNLNETKAFYTACITIVYKDYEYTTHGWMHGKVIDKQIGEGGFGYDPMFVPNGYTQTLGELDYEVKKSFSHRTKALELAKKVFEVIFK